MILNASIDEYYCSSTNGFGFKVLLHSPHELPEVDHYGIGIANGYETRIITAPIVSAASDAVRKVSVNIRNCLFENENFLSLYRSVILNAIFNRLSFFKFLFMLIYC